MSGRKEESRGSAGLGRLAGLSAVTSSPFVGEAGSAGSDMSAGGAGSGSGGSGDRRDSGAGRSWAQVTIRCQADHVERWRGAYLATGRGAGLSMSRWLAQIIDDYVAGLEATHGGTFDAVPAGVLNKGF